jgi:predicted dehydrogenase
MKACVIGVGSMGRNHARLLTSFQNVDLIGIVDRDIERASDLAEVFRTKAYSELDELLAQNKPDFAVVAVPTFAHVHVASTLIRAGVHVLIEKPISSTVEEADELIALAAEQEVFLSVGHVERFNPAVLNLKQRLDAGELGDIFHIETRRRGPFPKHVLDVGVALDLTVHDLDLISFISDDEIMSVDHILKRRIHKTHEDFVRAIIELKSGAVATMGIDWLTPTKIRDISVTGERGMFRVDLLTQDLTFYENTEAMTSDWDRLSALRGVNEGRVIKYVINKSEPLANELRSFIESIENKKAPLVSGVDGKNALLFAQSLSLQNQKNL